MRDLRNSIESVYIILRVYSLDSEHLGLRAFVNPAKLEEDGTLQFKAEKWTVVGL